MSDTAPKPRPAAGILKMVVVAVGDRKAIAPQLERLNLGRTEIRDADGRVIR